MLSKSDYLDKTVNIIGLVVSRAQYSIYMINNSNLAAISVKLTFENGSFIVVQCASDGESLLISREDIEAADLGDLGRLDLLDADKFDPASLRSCVGSAAKSITVQVDDNSLKTLRIDWGDHKTFFSNVGDTLNFDEARFNRMISEEGWKDLAVITFPLEE